MAKERRIKEVQTGGGAGRRVLAFFLGFLLGIIFLVGALGGAAYYVYTRPIKDTLELLGQDEDSSIYQALFGNGTEAGFLAPDYANKKVSTLIKDTTTAVSALAKGGSLTDVEKISPKVRTTVQKLLETTNEYGVPLEENDLMSKPITELGSYTGTKMKETPVGGLLKGFNGGVETEDPIMLALCYGEEDVDYVYENGEIKMLDGTNGITINELLTGTGVTDQINKMPLEAVDIDPDDPIMRTLAYGPASHYTTITDSKGTVVRVEMKQMTFTYDGSKLYDIDGDEVDGTFNPETGILTLKEGGVYYLEAKTKTGGETTYVAFSNAEKSKPALYKKSKINDLTQNASSLVDDMYLSDALDVNNESHKVLISLAYGAEGEDYTVDKDGKIQLKEGVSPRTIGDLKGDNEELINGIYLKDALNITPDSHKVLIALAYGKKDIDYELVDGEFIMKEGKTPKTLGDISGDKSTELINDIYIADALDVTPASHRVLISIAYGHENEDYIIVGDEICPVDADTPLKPRTLGELSGDNSSEVINGIYLADALNVTPETDNVLITLAYGKAGKDYKIENDKFVMQGDSKPRTLNDLSGDISTLLNDIMLADVMDPDFDSPIIMYLLYGREGIHYKKETKNGETVATALQQRIAILGEEAYNPYGELLTGTFDDGNIIRTLDTANKTYTVTVKEGTGASQTTTTTVYKYTETPAEGTPATPATLMIEGVGEATYVFLTDEAGTPVYYGTTLGELSGYENKISMLTKRLTIRELLGDAETEDNIFLKHVQDETIDTLPDAINDLTFTDVYAQDIYETVGINDSNYSNEANGLKSYFVDANGKPVKYADGTIVYTGDDISTVKDKLVVTSTWWYLLHNDEKCHEAHCKGGLNCSNEASACPLGRTCEVNSCSLDEATCHAGNKDQGGEHWGHCHLGDSCPYKTEADDGVCEAIPDCSRKGCVYDYKITEFDALVTNMTDNMKSATLLCLEHDGIVDLSAEELHVLIKSEISLNSLNVTVPIETPKRTEIKTDENGDPITDESGNPIYSSKVYLYEMTINEILTYASDVLDAITQLEETVNGSIS